MHTHHFIYTEEQWVDGDPDYTCFRFFGHLIQTGPFPADLSVNLWWEGKHEHNNHDNAVKDLHSPNSVCSITIIDVKHWDVTPTNVLYYHILHKHDTITKSCNFSPVKKKKSDVLVSVLQYCCFHWRW